jgi:hypothetical protein
MMATGNVPDVDMPPLADMNVGEAHDQEGGEEDDPVIDVDGNTEEEDPDGLSPQSRVWLNARMAVHVQAPRPDNTFGSPFALQ